MRKLGQSRLLLQLTKPIERVPAGLERWHLELAESGTELVYSYAQVDGSEIALLLRQVGDSGLVVKTLQTRQSSLEDIFVNLVRAQS